MPPFFKSISPVSILTLPSRTTFPVPLGVIAIFPLDVETKAFPFTSKSPPNCGVVSSTTFEISVPAESPATKVLLDIFLSPPQKYLQPKEHHHLQL